MAKPLTLGYLIPQFPGQTHIFFWREILALERMGINVALFSTRPPPPGLISHSWSEEAIARTEYLGQIKPVEAAKTALGISPTLYARDVLREGKALAKDLAISAAAAHRLRDICRDRGVSHVHVHSCGRAALVAMLANRLGGPDYSLTLHGDMGDYGIGQRLKWRHAKFATVVTEKLLSELPGHLGDDRPDRVIVQPMGVDPMVLQRDTPYVPYAGGRPLQLFSCGRLNRIKGHDDLMKSVRILLAKGIDVHLTIAGEDDDGGVGYRQVLETVRDNLKLRDHVTFLGAVDAETVKSHLVSTDIFTLASWHEALGVVYMEAMSCETPVIGVRTGGVPELIRDGVDGLMVPPQDPEAMAEAILKLAADPDMAMRLSSAGRQRILEKFSCHKGAEVLAREALDLRISKEI